MPEDQLLELSNNVLKSLTRSRTLKALFKYLWDNRHQCVNAEVIWADALAPVSRSQTNFREHNYTQNVRDRCRELRNVLRDYNASGPSSSYSIDLPPSESDGYRLEVHKKDAQDLVGIFWQPHLSPPRDVFIIYVEHPYYHCWPQRLVFRYHDSDQGNEQMALADLQARHQEMYDACKEGLAVVYSLVASGVIDARDKIGAWFERGPFIKVKNMVSRYVQQIGPVWHSSLILLGGAHSNSVIAAILEKTPNLPFAHQHDVEITSYKPWRVFVANPSEEEMPKFSRYDPVLVEGGCILNFRPEKGVVLAILTRIPNPHRRDVIVTIIDTDFGRVLQQFGRWLTEEDEIRRFALPSECFQMLIAVEIPTLSDDDRPSEPEIIAVRPLSFGRIQR